MGHRSLVVLVAGWYIVGVVGVGSLVAGRRSLLAAVVGSPVAVVGGSRAVVPHNRAVVRRRAAADAPWAVDGSSLAVGQTSFAALVEWLEIEYINWLT